MSTSHEPSGSNIDAWTRALFVLAKESLLSPSPEETRLYLLNARHLPIREAIAGAARELGLRPLAIALKGVKGLASFTPCLAEINDGTVLVIKRVEKKTAVIVVASPSGAVERSVDLKWLATAINGSIVAMATTARARDSRIDAYLAPYQRSWFRALLIRHAMRFTELAGGTFIYTVGADAGRRGCVVV
jgi:ATP-binding cassette, subfamily C, bacterial LapB